MNGTIKLSEPGALLCSQDLDGGVHVIRTDSNGLVLVSPESAPQPRTGLGGGAGAAILLTFLGVAYLIGRSHR